MAKVDGYNVDVDCKSQFRQALLQVNGQRIPLNPFVQNIIAKTVTGMVDSLDKDADSIQRIELMVRNREKPWKLLTKLLPGLIRLILTLKTFNKQIHYLTD